MFMGQLKPTCHFHNYHWHYTQLHIHLDFKMFIYFPFFFSSSVVHLIHYGHMKLPGSYGPCTGQTPENLCRPIWFFKDFRTCTAKPHPEFQNHCKPHKGPAQAFTTGCSQLSASPIASASGGFLWTAQLKNGTPQVQSKRAYVSSLVRPPVGKLKPFAPPPPPSVMQRFAQAPYIPAVPLQLSHRCSHNAHTCTLHNP